MELTLQPSILIAIDETAQTRDELFVNFSQLVSNKYPKIEASVIENALLERENVASTAFEKGLAMPHARIKGLTNPLVIILKTKNQLIWESLDGQPITKILGILVPANQESKHLEILGHLATQLLNENIQNTFETAQNEIDLNNLANQLFNENQVENEVEIQENRDYYVAVSACTFGLSHTYIAEQKLLNYAHEHNWNLKVETHGVKGDLNLLTQADLDKAKGLILAIDRPLEIEHLQHSNVVKVRTIDAIRNPQKLFDSVNQISKQEANHLSNLFQIKMPQAFFSFASLAMNFTQWVVLAFAIFFLGLAGVLNGQMMPKWSQELFIAMIFVSSLVPSLLGFSLVHFFTKNKNLGLIYAAFIAVFSFKINYVEEQSLGCLIALTFVWMPILWEKMVILKIRQHWSKQRRLTSIAKWFLNLILFGSLIVCLYFTSQYFSWLNHQIYGALRDWDQKWWFRSLIASMILFMMAWDMGGPINKMAIIISSFLFVDSWGVWARESWTSIEANGHILSTINNWIWVTPITAQVVGITTFGIGVWIRSLFWKKKINENELKHSKKSGKDSFNGISESTLWIYETYGLKVYLSQILAAIWCGLIIGFLHIQYFGGYNMILGFLCGFSYDNVLNNNWWNVLPPGMPSFNLGFLILTTFGPLGVGIIYSLIWPPKHSTKIKTEFIINEKTKAIERVHA